MPSTPKDASVRRSKRKAAALEPLPTEDIVSQAAAAAPSEAESPSKGTPSPSKLKVRMHTHTTTGCACAARPGCARGEGAHPHFQVSAGIGGRTRRSHPHPTMTAASPSHTQASHTQQTDRRAPCPSFLPLPPPLSSARDPSDPHLLTVPVVAQQGCAGTRHTRLAHTPPTSTHRSPPHANQTTHIPV